MKSAYNIDRKLVIVGVFSNSLILRVVQLCLVILMYSSRQVWVILLVGIQSCNVSDKKYNTGNMHTF